jgi:hypothetical protein
MQRIATGSLKLGTWIVINGYSLRTGGQLEGDCLSVRRFKIAKRAKSPETIQTGTKVTLKNSRKNSCKVIGGHLLTQFGMGPGQCVHSTSIGITSARKMYWHPKQRHSRNIQIHALQQVA